MYQRYTKYDHRLVEYSQVGQVIMKKMLLIMFRLCQQEMRLTLVTYLQGEEILRVHQMVMEVLVSYQAQDTAEYLIPSLASVTP